MSAAAGGAGAHAGAGTEGSMHGSSAGAAPLLARQTTIAWPVVGSKGDGDLRIPDRGSGTGRAVLVLLSQPPGAVAMALLGLAANEACECEGAPRRRLMSTGSGGPGIGRGLGPGGGEGTPRRGSGPRGGTGGGGGLPEGGGLRIPWAWGGSISLPSLRPQHQPL